MTTDNFFTRGMIELNRGELFSRFFPLCFSFYYFIPVFIHPLTPFAITLASACFLLFMALYSYAITRLEPTPWPAIVIIALGAFTTGINSGASNFFIYACFFLGLTLSASRFFLSLAGVIALTFLLAYLYQYEFIFFTIYVLIGAPALGFWGIFVRMQDEASKQEKRSREEISSLAKTLERERIARDLHDVIGHTLSTITLKAELAHKLLLRKEHDKSQRELEQLLTVSRDGLKQVRNTISGVKRADLAEELSQLMDVLRQRDIEVAIEGELPALNDEAESALGLILTELTTNILRHSKANHCKIHFSQTAANFTLTVCDNGPTDSIKPGNGLSGIEQRTQALGGSVRFYIDQGFCTSINLPRASLV